jgi:hypothetical protein
LNERAVAICRAAGINPSDQSKEEDMKRIVLAAALSLIASVAFAQSPPSCKAQSVEKKLHGAAEKSFITKCTKDAQAACAAQAAEKKLAGAAKNSFTKKCVSDAVGT